jgi:hypothetical protein
MDCGGLPCSRGQVQHVNSTLLEDFFQIASHCPLQNKDRIPEALE